LSGGVTREDAVADLIAWAQLKASRNEVTDAVAALVLGLLDSVRLSWSSIRVGFPFRNHPPKPAEECVDVHCPSFPCPAIDLNRDSLRTSLSISSVKDHLDIGMTGKTPRHRLVHQRISSRNDQQMRRHGPRLKWVSRMKKERHCRHNRKRFNAPTLTTDVARLQA
jgi:hypothetical protein